MRIHHSSRSASILVEAAIAAAILMVIAVMTTQSIVSSITANRMAAISAMVDARLDQETSTIRRLSIADVIAIPTTPQVTTNILLGTLYEMDVRSDLVRVRQTQSNSDLGISQHTIVVGLTYSIANRDYVRTRSTVRNEIQ